MKHRHLLEQTEKFKQVDKLSSLCTGSASSFICPVVSIAVSARGASLYSYVINSKLAEKWRLGSAGPDAQPIRSERWVKHQQSECLIAVFDPRFSVAAFFGARGARRR